MAVQKQTALKILKSKNENQAKEISHNTKRLERLEEYYKYKQFLDKLAAEKWKNESDEDKYQLVALFVENRGPRYQKILRQKKSKSTKLTSWALTKGWLSS